MFEEWWNDLDTSEKVGFVAVTACAIAGTIGFAVGTRHGIKKENKRIESAAYARMVDDYIDNMVKAKTKIH